MEADQRATKVLTAEMNRPAYCYHCRSITETFLYDCTECGYSKPHPDALFENVRDAHEEFVDG